MAGLQLLKHTFNLSDEQVVVRWTENPYWQFFCGEEFFRHKLPINPSQMTRWRQRIGEKGVEKLLQITIEAGKATKTITERSFEKVIVDTTVQPKTIQHPTDARQYRKVHAAMLRIAEKEGLDLRQSYRVMMERAFRKHGGHMKAKQFKRARKVLRSLRTMAGRIMRDVERKLDEEAFTRRKGNPFDGYTLEGQLDQVERLTGRLPKLIFVDRGYKGHDVPEARSRVLISGTRKLGYTLKRHLRRRAAIEPEIGHMKADGLLGRNFLKGMQGDAINAMLCGVGHNLRKILARIWALLWLLSEEVRGALQAFLAAAEGNGLSQQPLEAA